MSTSEVIFVKTLCWLVLVGFAFVSVELHLLFAAAASPDRTLWCGRNVTAPLGAILSLGTPLGIAAVFTLGALWHRGWATAWSVVPASVLVLTCTGSLLISGLRFFHDSLPGFYLSQIVWWMRPIGHFLGV